MKSFVKLSHKPIRARSLVAGLAGLLLLGVSLSGCIVEPIGGGYHHFSGGGGWHHSHWNGGGWH
jgi:hypothetical protein